MSYCCFLLASISSGQLSKPRKAVQLRFLHKLCSPKYHRRQPVDCSVPSYRGHERFSEIPPAAAGGSFSPKLCFPLLDARAGIERSTGCRRWDSRAFLGPCRPGLNDPPAAAGGIPESQNLCRNFSCLVCAVSSTDLLPIQRKLDSLRYCFRDLSLYRHHSKVESESLLQEVYRTTLAALTLLNQSRER